MTFGVERGDAAARLWVADAGEGIFPEDLGRVFDRFVRVGRRASRTEGTGLGLPMVLAIARAHGGEVQVHSEPGRGSRFVLLLPFDTGPQPRPTEPAAPER